MDEGARRDRFVRIFFWSALAVGAFFYLSFFRGVLSTTAEWTGSGFVWPYQLFHNFLHGRAFQSSLFARDDGLSVGFIDNPYGFVNANVIHVNWTPYLFAPLWALSQTPAWYYGIQALWCVGASAFFAVAILRRLDPEGWRPKAGVALAVLASGGLLSILNQMGQLLCYAGPLMLAVYHALITGRRGWFFVWLLLLCGVTEDAAMVAVTFSAYIVVFEPEHRKQGLWAAAVSFAYLVFALGFVQPAARAELKVVTSSTASFIIAHLFHLGARQLAANLFSMLPALSLLPALGLAAALFGGPDAAGWLGLAALAVVPGLPHWAESFVVGGAHHLFPPFFGTYLALLVLLGRGRRPAMARRAAFAWLGVYAALSLRVLAGNLPAEMKLPILRRLRPAQAAGLERSLGSERESNLALIAAARALPADASLCYLGNNRPEGYVIDRSDVWIFPEYYADVRYILIQKDANDVVTVVEPREGETLAALAARTKWVNRREVALPPAVPALFVRALVAENRTHRVVQDDAHVLLLENLHPNTPPSPETTHGFGWVRNLGRRPQRVTRPAADPS